MAFNGNIWIWYVWGKNRPPLIDLSRSHNTIMTHTLTAVNVSGTDPDSKITTIKILSLPRQGRLYIITGQGRSRSSTLLDATYLNLSSGEFPFPLTAEYVHTGPEAPTLNGGTVIALDSFLVTLVDEEGRHSMEGNVTIEVVPALSGTVDFYKFS